MEIVITLALAVSVAVAVYFYVTDKQDAEVKSGGSKEPSRPNLS